MDYADEIPIRLKKMRRDQAYSDIKGEGIFIRDQLIRFSPKVVLERLELYLPEGFIEMPEEFAAMKYPSVNRPQMILTSLDGSTNFAFNLLTEGDVPYERIGGLAGQMKGLLRRSDPSYVFEREEMGRLSNGSPIYMFDHRSFGVDEKLYNMVCFTAFQCGVVHGVFNCLERDMEQWRGAAWQAFLTMCEAEKTIG